MNRINVDHVSRVRPYVPLLADTLNLPTGERITLRPFTPSSDAERADELALRNHARMEQWKARRLAVRMQRVVKNMREFVAREAV